MAGAGETHSEFSGRAEHAVQARDVSGGVHFYGAGLVRPVPRELPGPQQEFVDHVDQIKQLSAIADLLGEADYSLTTVLSGIAGVGKTSLALFWAYRERGRFPDGQLYVNLRGYDPGLPVPAAAALDRFLRALGVAAGEIPLDLEARSAAFRSAIAGRRMLIVLDNAVDASHIKDLLPGEPGCLVVVTSRSDLPGLGRAGVHHVPVDVLSDGDAAELFASVTRGQRDLGDQASHAEIVRLWARLPLALPRLAMLRLLLSGLAPVLALISRLGRLEFLRTFFVGLPGVPPTVEPGDSPSSSEPIIAVMPVTLLAVRVRTELSSSKSSSSPEELPNPRSGTL